jgi:hypothetical protein
MYCSRLGHLDYLAIDPLLPWSPVPNRGYAEGRWDHRRCAGGEPSTLKASAAPQSTLLAPELSIRPLSAMRCSLGTPACVRERRGLSSTAAALDVVWTPATCLITRPCEPRSSTEAPHERARGGCRSTLRRRRGWRHRRFPSGPRDPGPVSLGRRVPLGARGRCVRPCGASTGNALAGAPVAVGGMHQQRFLVLPRSGRSRPARAGPITAASPGRRACYHSRWIRGRVAG